MGILFRYILREVVVSSLIGAVLFTFVLFLRSVGPVMELLVRAGTDPADVGRLFLLTVPRSLPFTIPMGVLVGVLIALGRLSGDGEITAMRAAGIPGRKCVYPVLAFSLFGVAVCAAVTLWVSPWAAREFRRVSETLKISQATAEVRPRVFIENFPDKVLYVRDVIPGDVVRWRGLFLADTRSPELRGSVSGLNAAVDGPRITVADEAVVIPLPEQDRLQLHLPHASTYEQSFDPTQYQVFDYEVSDQVIDTEPDRFDPRKRPFDQMDSGELRAAAAGAGKNDENPIDAGIVFQQRLALPIACLVLPLAGIPLAISRQRSGKSTGVVLSVVLAFVYWMILLAGTALAKEAYLPPAPAMWLANALFAALGLSMLSQLDSPRRRDVLAWVGARVQACVTRLCLWFAARRKNGKRPALENRSVVRRSLDPAGPILEPVFSILDRYVLKTFLFYLGLMTAVFVSIWFVFSFFELLSDMLARGKMALFIPYIYYLTPFLVYETAPLAVMAATLIAFGILVKHSELTAFHACGVSVYRLALPVIIASLGLSGLLFAMDHYYLPETNRKQDAIRNEIKGRPVRTFLRPDRQWTFGPEGRIFYHRFFDWENKELAGVNVYDFRAEPYQLRRHISAERARWDDEMQAWVFENGWVRELVREDGRTRIAEFEQFQAKAFPDIVETPDYFRKEERQHQQMNWRELRGYIHDLTQRGFDTVRLRVLWHRKFSFPFFALAMTLLAIPFAVLSGNRSALAPVALSLGLAIAYYSLSALAEQLGRAGQLTPYMAAWAPGLIFGLSGTYLFLRVRS